MAVTQNDAIEERRREIQKRRKAQKTKRRKAALKRFLIFLSIVLVATLVILSLTVFFPVEKITVSAENSRYTSEQIIEASGIKKGENLWMTGFNAEEDIPVKLPFVAEAEVQRKFPSSIVIKTIPAKAVYNLMVENNYYVCDSEYKVLEIAKAPSSGLMLISGVEISKTKAGNVIAFTDDKKQELIQNLISLLNGKSIVTNLIDATEPMDIIIRVNGRFNVLLGSTAHIEAKLSHLAGMLQNVDDDVKGSIDLSDYTPENGRGILTRE